MDRHCNRAKLTLGEKSLATPGTQTHISIAPVLFLFFSLPLQSDTLVTELSNPVIKSDPTQDVVDKLQQLLNSVGH